MAWDYRYHMLCEWTHNIEHVVRLYRLRVNDRTKMSRDNFWASHLNSKSQIKQNLNSLLQ